MIYLSQESDMLKLFDELIATEFVQHQISKKIEEYGIDPNNINQQDFAKKLISNGMELSEQGKYDESEMCFYCVTALDNNYTAIWYNLALGGNYPLESMLILSSGEKNPISTYDKVLDLHPTNTRALIWKGLSLDRKKKFDEGIACYKKAIRINPRSAWILTNATNVNSVVYQNHKEAVFILNALLRISPNQPFLVWVMGQEFSGLRKNKEALECFNSVLQIESNNVSVLIDKGTTLDNLRKPDQALVFFDRAIHLEPNHFIALGNRGVVLQELGRDEEALASYNKSLEIEPQNANTLYNKARLVAKHGKDDESLGLLKQAIDLNKGCKERVKNAPEFNYLREDSRFKKITN